VHDAWYMTTAPIANQLPVFPVRIRAKEFRLSVRFREGGNDLVLFVHGLGCSKENWRSAWQRPELRGRSLLAPDLPGFGHSESPPGFTPDLVHYAEVLRALIDAHAMRRIHLVAHSMGGSVALLLPPPVLSRLENLVLVEPRLCGPSCGVATMAVGVSLEEFRKSVFPDIRQRMSADPRAVFDLKRVDINAFYAGSRSLMEWSAHRGLLERFEQADCRKFFIYGADNRHLKELDFVEPLRTIAIEDSAHFVMNDNPDGFYACLQNILDNSG
jgi:pimeloyl-ACP methyl ester carboxylesterase